MKLSTSSTTKANQKKNVKKKELLIGIACPECTAVKLQKYVVHLLQNVAAKHKINTKISANQVNNAS